MKRNANRLRQLRAFCHAAQSNSISKAAEKLDISQPSVSLQIQALEKELDVLLFERRGPRISLTPAGDTLLELAQPLVDGMDKLPEAKRFCARFPHVTVRLHNVTGHDGMAKLRADEVDFAVGSMLDVPEDLTYHPIHDYTPTLITAPEHPLAERETISLEDISPYGSPTTSGSASSPASACKAMTTSSPTR